MNSNLYEITSDYIQALDNLEIDEETGEILNFEELDALESALETKAENVALYIKNLAAFAVNLKAEEQNLAARRKSAEKKAENLKKYLTSCLEAAGCDKMETAKKALAAGEEIPGGFEREPEHPDKIGD